MASERVKRVAHRAGLSAYRMALAIIAVNLLTPEVSFWSHVLAATALVLLADADGHAHGK